MKIICWTVFGKFALLRRRASVPAGKSYSYHIPLLRNRWSPRGYVTLTWLPFQMFSKRGFQMWKKRPTLTPLIHTNTSPFAISVLRHGLHFKAQLIRLRANCSILGGLIQKSFWRLVYRKHKWDLHRVKKYPEGALGCCSILTKSSLSPTWHS